MAGIKLGEILVKQGLIRPDQMAKAMEEQKKTGGKLISSILNLNIIKENQILKP